MTSLSARDVSIALGRQTLVKAASLDLTPGTLMGLVGPNGAGKSTLMRGLCALSSLSGGEVRIGDASLSSLSRQTIARSIAYLPQRGVLHWKLETRQVVALGRLPHTPADRPPSEADQVAVENAIVQADIGSLLGRSVDTLSGGERARVMLARALAVQAPILMVDEPVASLDPFHALQIMELLRTLAHGGQSVLVVLHDLSLAMRFCDQLVLMREGQVIREGVPRFVLQPAGLEDAYRVDGVYGERDLEPYLVPWSRLPHHSPAGGPELGL